MTERSLPPVRYTRTSDGVSIAYMVWPGESPAWVWVYSPGGAPMTVTATRPAFSPLITGRERVAFDYRGTGQSEARPASSMAEFVLDLQAVVHAAGGPPDLFATNGGCFPACALVAQNPDACRSLFLVDPMVRTSEAPQGTMVRGGYHDYDAYLYSLARTFFTKLPEETLNGFVADFARQVPEPVHRAYNAMLNEADLSTTLPSIRVPVLVSRTLPFSAASRVASLIPGSVLTETDYGSVGQLRADWDEHIGSKSGDTPKPPSAIPNGVLTEQQQKVLALIARGRTNAQIADELTLSEATVKTHVRNILTKLEVSNRVEAAAWWLERRR